MTPLKKAVNALLNEEQGFRIWFGMLLHYLQFQTALMNTIISPLLYLIWLQHLYKKVTEED
jgi:2-haloacid dehalogenase